MSQEFVINVNVDDLGVDGIGDRDFVHSISAHGFFFVLKGVFSSW